MAADGGGGKCSSIFLALFFEYDTEKIVRIRNKKVGIINRVIQLVIIGYIIGYVIVYQKGYQEFQAPYSSVTTKLKGVSFTNLSGLDLFGGPFAWDPADLVIPPEENGAIFVMTNMVITPNQTQSTCPEDPRLQNTNCSQDSDCKYMATVPGGHGVNTGKCVPSDRGQNKVCEVYAWCPVETDALPMPGFNLSQHVPLLESVRNFTLLIKNTVQFPKFDETRRNIDKDEDGLKNCRFDPVKSPLCPIFQLDMIENLAGVNFDKMAYEGGVMSVEITWNCNFDALAEHCEPKYSFRRLDSTDSPIAPGYNFRFSRYFIKDDKLYRMLIKAYGIRFVMNVYGRGGKFSVVPLFLNIGSGLALLAIATVLCDIVVIYIVQKRNLYKEKKYLNVEDEIHIQDDDAIKLSYSASSGNSHDTETSDGDDGYEDIQPGQNYNRFK